MGTLVKLEERGKKEVIGWNQFFSHLVICGRMFLEVHVTHSNNSLQSVLWMVASWSSIFECIVIKFWHHNARYHSTVVSYSNTSLKYLQNATQNIKKKCLFNELCTGKPCSDRHGMGWEKMTRINQINRRFLMTTPKIAMICKIIK